MSHALLIMGIVIAIGGKFVGVAFIALSKHKSTVPWIVFSMSGYLMVVGSQLGRLS